MKNSITYLSAVAVAAATLIIAVPAGRAQDRPGVVYVMKPVPFYISGQVGGELMQDLNIKNAGGAKNHVDPGFRTSVSIGADLSDYVAAEFETGVLGNQLDTSSGQPLSGLGDNVYLYQVPLLANIIFKAPFRDGITPYIGGGAGGMASTLYLKRGDDWSSDTDFNFAYQAMAGIKFALNRNMEIGLGYKFLATPDHTWFPNDSRFVRSGQMFSHSILASFTWTF
jgi:opacity protein-like surface antigen